MNRVMLAGLLAVALGGSAMAQTDTATSSSSTTNNKVYLAKPPPGTAPPTTKKPRVNSNNLNNTPLTPQIAIQPGPTIGSPVPINGPGGTTMNPSTGY
jgi:hypothetical protein